MSKKSNFRLSGSVGFLLILVALVLTACGVPAISSDALAGDLQEIEVAAVQVEIGVGSPIPVDVFVSGTWPGLCAQIAEIEQQVGENQFDIRLLATPDTPGCPPDQLGLPFRIAIPLNMVEQPVGEYTVIVNGVNTTFEWNPGR